MSDPATATCSRPPSPLRVLFLVHEFPALSQTFVVNQAVGVLAQGHDLTIATLVDAPVAPRHQEDVARWSLLERVCRPAPVSRNPLARAVGAVSLLGPGQPGFGNRLSLLDPFRHGRDAVNLRVLHRFGPLASLGRFDVIHAQFGTVAMEALHLRRAGLLQGRLLTTFRGYDISSVLRERGQQYYADLFAEGDRFLTNCRFFRDRLLALGCPADRLTVLPSGLDVSRFPYAARPAWDGHRPIELLFVGRLVPKKGVDDALHAASAAARQGIPLRLTIAGDGWMRERLTALAGELGLGNQVRFLGDATAEEVADLLAAADLFIAPSKTAEDGDQDAPTNVLKEAMASGLPVLSTRHGGIPELVEDGISGHLVEEGDAAALGRSLCLLAAQPDRWAAMGRAGRSRVIATYDLDRLNRDLCANYAAMLAAPSHEGASRQVLRPGLGRRSRA